MLGKKIEKNIHKIIIETMNHDLTKIKPYNINLWGKNDNVPTGDSLNKLKLKLMPKDYDVNLLKKNHNGIYILPSLEELRK